jgi:glycosyltransferase involved in cell wall biosynthesis
MKILFINNLGTLHGGAEIMSDQLRRGLVERGHEVRILAGNQHGNGEYIADYTFKTFGGDSILKIFFVFNPFALLALWKTLRQYKPDVVHLHNVSKASPFILPLLKNYPTVLTIHDYLIFDPTRIKDIPSIEKNRSTLGNYFIDKPSLRFYIEKLRFIFFRSFSNKYIDAAIVCSNFFLTCAEESGLFNRIELVHNGIILPEQRPFINWNTILFVGRLDKIKGVNVLIEAGAKVKTRHPEIKIAIAGDGTELAYLKKITEDLDMKNIVRFFGHQTPEKLTHLYDNSAIIAAPSLGPDNLPIVCIEAMATGRPVIGSDIGGIPDLIENGKNGILIPPNDPDSLADSINILLDDRELMEKMGENGRQKAESKFSAKTYTEKTIRVYEDIINKKTKC